MPWIARLRAPLTPAGQATRATAAASSVLVNVLSGLLLDSVATRILLLAIGVGAVIWAGATIVIAGHGGDIVLDLNPGDPHRDWDGYPAQVALAQAKTERPNPALIRRRLSTNPTRRAAELAEVKRRLNSASGNGAQDVTVYLNATLHDSFALGRLVRTGSFPLSLMQKSGFGQSMRYYPSVRLGSHLREPLTDTEGQQAGFLHHQTENLAVGTERLALMVVLSATPQEVVPKMRGAAGTGRSEEYVIGPGDRCRAALVITADRQVDEDSASFELTVRYIYQQWTAWLAGQDATGEHLLFLAGPTTIAMGLGWVFGPHRWRFVAHEPSGTPTVPTRARR
ncbi:MAG TPA: hypothetical protein VFX70_07285 [Mycobacteriales bacterium]|nr:hypothetical protein [Mycobacteriales bacterium]